MERRKITKNFFLCFKEFQESSEKQFLFCVFNTCNQADIFMLHGGGIESGIHHYNALRKNLYDFKISSCSFDFAGHGKGGGLITDSSLVQRTDEAYEVTISGRIKNPITVLGTNMGAHTALKLTERCEIKNLILIAPVYDRQAMKLFFWLNLQKLFVDQ